MNSKVQPLRSGDEVPDFSTKDESGNAFSKSSLIGKRYLLYFYPRDNTPGCTTEAMNFRDQYDAFEKAGAVVYGISRDSLKSHENFKAKLELPFELIADVDEAMRETGQASGKVLILDSKASASGSNLQDAWYQANRPGPSVSLTAWVSA